MQKCFSTLSVVGGAIAELTWFSASKMGWTCEFASTKLSLWIEIPRELAG